MESSWDEQIQHSAGVPSPDWHGDVLAERLLAVQEDKTSFIEWEFVKNRLRERFENSSLD